MFSQLSMYECRYSYKVHSGISPPQNFFSSHAIYHVGNTFTGIPFPLTGEEIEGGSMQL